MWLDVAKSPTDLLKWPLASWWPFLVAMVCLVVVIWLVVQLIARVNKDADPAEADHQMLLALSDLHREGDLTAEEFRSIKSQLVHRLSSNEGRFTVNKKTAESAAAGSAASDEANAESGVQLSEESDDRPPEVAPTENDGGAEGSDSGDSDGPRSEADNR